MEMILPILLQLLPIILKLVEKAIDGALKKELIDAEMAASYKEHIRAAQSSIKNLGDEYMTNKAARQALKDRVRKRRIQAETKDVK